MTEPNPHCPVEAFPNVEEWTEQQSNAGENYIALKGACEVCQKEDVYLRLEPFANNKACKKCWELICYGD